MGESRKTIADALKGIGAGLRSKPTTASPSAGSPAVPKSRQGRRGLLTYHDSATIKQLQALALEEDMSQQKLVVEALNLLFVKYGKPPIA
jgi:hypothetical protein